ncbi:MAG: capsular polysaccharide synthesis protein [Streptococcaceae bacterium]|nr:capsular polysaccharide synthesis protein [Streptococcaceae bacterium]
MKMKMKMSYVVFRVKKKLISSLISFKILKRKESSLYNKKHQLIQKYIEREIGSLIMKYSESHFQSDTIDKISNEAFYMMWWQSEQTPSFVYRNIRFLKKQTNAQVILLSKNNLVNFLPHLPAELWKKIDEKSITLAQLSDIVRMAILSKYGGIWIDSTVVTLNTVSDDIFSNNIFTPVDDKGNYKFVPSGRWNIYLLGGKPHRKYFEFLYEALLFFNLNSNKIPDYFLVDYLFSIAYDFNIGGLKDDLESLGSNNIEVNDFQKVMNLPFSQSYLAKFTKNTSFFKTSWKEKHFSKDVNGKLTFWGYLEEL